MKAYDYFGYAYYVSDREAGKLAKGIGSRLPAWGYELVFPKNHPAFFWHPDLWRATQEGSVRLFRTKCDNRRGWCWAVY